MPRTIASDAARGNLSSFRHKLGQDLDVFVIDFELLIRAKSTHLPANHGATSAPSTPLLFCPLAAPSWG